MDKSKVVYVQISKELKKARVARHMTQETLAAASGVPAAYIGFIEAGHRRPTVSTICKLTSALGISLEKHIFKGL
ncbi:MAG TPA: helix-turn-helix transcriptional regulator [Patescibacteria group bacterium]|nr:helix-turn-helix transcriptional regulator [Patescibacteria group bacterium]